MYKTAILFYDGDCALCNISVQFVIDHEIKTTTPLLFCSLQSAYAKQILSKYNYNFTELSTLVLWVDDKIFYRSDAALNLSKYLKIPYNWLFILKIFPKFIRDSIYKYVAKNRKILIKTPFCYMPSADIKKRFIG